MPTPLHILAIGQSNLANHCGTPRKSGTGEVLFAGRLMRLCDPVPGGTGEDGSVWTRVSPLLAEKRPDRILRLALVARGGTSVAEWAPGGACFNALEARLAAGDALNARMIVFQQGEKDTLLETTAEDYEARFRALHDALTARLGLLPWIICRASYRFGVTSASVIAAQNKLVATLPQAYAGPALDRLGRSFRQDDTHFNDEGLDAFAEELAISILNVLADGEIAT